MTPAQIRAHARVSLVIAEVLEGLADLPPVPFGECGYAPHEVPFSLTWRRELGTLDVEFPRLDALIVSVEACWWPAGRGEIAPRFFPLDDVTGIVAFVRERVGR